MLKAKMSSPAQQPHKQCDNRADGNRNREQHECPANEIFQNIIFFHLQQFISTGFIANSIIAGAISF
ncbi:hypothetical protein PBAL39_21085 [Pedobacter sp. BAL39]|nr:hypothetical protein PBAL39_21085 [Pedobacter sp. BAL39]